MGRKKSGRKRKREDLEDEIDPEDVWMTLSKKEKEEFEKFHEEKEKERKRNEENRLQGLLSKVENHLTKLRLEEMVFLDILDGIFLKEQGYERLNHILVDKKEEVKFLQNIVETDSKKRKKLEKYFFDSINNSNEEGINIEQSKIDEFYRKLTQLSVTGNSSVDFDIMIHEVQCLGMLEFIEIENPLTGKKTYRITKVYFTHEQLHKSCQKLYKTGNLVFVEEKKEEGKKNI